MRYPKSWNAQHNMYGLTVSAAGVFELGVYAEQPGGQRRRIVWTFDAAHAEALARALQQRLATLAKAEGTS